MSSLVDNVEQLEIKFVVNGNSGFLHSSYGILKGAATSFGEVAASEDLFLNAGDKVKLFLSQSNSGNATINVAGGLFSGHLLFAN